MDTTDDDADIVTRLERLLVETSSDFAGLGMIDAESRRLRWRFAAGSISERTLNVAQKPSAGLSGAAMRSGRPSVTEGALTDAERFRLGEPIMLSEELRSAAAFPMGAGAAAEGVVLLGRRSVRGYEPEELVRATRRAIELAGGIGGPDGS